MTHRSDDLQLIEDEISLAKEQLIKAEQLRLECSRLQQIGKGMTIINILKNMLLTLLYNLIIIYCTIDLKKKYFFSIYCLGKGRSSSSSSSTPSKSKRKK